MSLQDQTILAPDFTLIDTHDQPIRLNDFRGRHAVVLVFNRGFL